MGSIAEREQLLRHVVRLRRAERSRGRDHDVAAVRRDLELALGPTVPRAMAARALGVSQPALARWIDAGDVPVVLTPTGRHEVPAGALVDLIATVEAEDGRHPLAAVLGRRRRTAAMLDADELVAVDSRDGHRLAELRGLAYHRAVARRLGPDVVADARDRLQRRRAAGRGHPTSLSRWERLLDRSPSEIAAAICADDDDGRALRQTSPFAGTLTEPERRRVLAAVDR